MEIRGMMPLSIAPCHVESLVAGRKNERTCVSLYGTTFLLMDFMVLFRISGFWYYQARRYDHLINRHTRAEMPQDCATIEGLQLVVAYELLLKSSNDCVQSLLLIFYV
jgi:hypothetical protein